MGIMFAGSSMASFVFPKLMEYLIRTYGFKGALLLMGAVVMNAAPFTLFVRRPDWLAEAHASAAIHEEFEKKCEISCKTVTPVEQIRSKKKGRLREAVDIITLPMFYVFLYSGITFSFSYDCYSSLLTDFAIDKGIPASDAITMTSVAAAGDLLGRILPAFAGDHGIDRRALYTSILFFMGVLLLLSPYVYSYYVLFAVGCGIAFGTGTAIVMLPVLGAEYLGVNKVPSMFGIVIALSGMTSFAKPPVIGK